MWQCVGVNFKLFLFPDMNEKLFLKEPRLLFKKTKQKNRLHFILMSPITLLSVKKKEELDLK